MNYIFFNNHLVEIGSDFSDDYRRKEKKKLHDSQCPLGKDMTFL